MSKARAFWPVLLVFLLGDCESKRVAEELLAPAGVPHDVVGDVVRLRLAYNEGAATGITVGQHSRLFFSLTALAGVALLGWLYRTAPRRDWRVGLASGLAMAGALGNLLDRVRSPMGVVDFIDIGIGDTRFWIFNVADVGITVGAALFAAILWRRNGLLAMDDPAGTA